jgi:hypothetical protein
MARGGAKGFGRGGRPWTAWMHVDGMDARGRTRPFGRSRQSGVDRSAGGLTFARVAGRRTETSQQTGAHRTGSGICAARARRGCTRQRIPRDSTGGTSGTRECGLIRQRHSPVTQRTWAYIPGFLREEHCEVPVMCLEMVLRVDWMGNRSIISLSADANAMFLRELEWTVSSDESRAHSGRVLGGVVYCMCCGDLVREIAWLQVRHDRSRSNDNVVLLCPFLLSDRFPIRISCNLKGGYELQEFRSFTTTPQIEQHPCSI